MLQSVNTSQGQLPQEAIQRSSTDYISEQLLPPLKFVDGMNYMNM